MQSPACQNVACCFLLGLATHYPQVLTCPKCPIYCRYKKQGQIKKSQSYYRMEENFGGCKLWRIGKENFIGRINFGKLITSLIKRILKQFEDTSMPNLSIRACVCAQMAVSSSVESTIRGYHEYKLIWNDSIL